ncbi:MAG: class I tRNA ligase family protein, partial [Minisyncoccia bacterium]
MEELPKTYNPKETEDKIYKLWLESGFFTPENLPLRQAQGKLAKKFVTCMAPPNITGELHMGHALELTLQDIIVRMKRMQGYKVLWLPGTDHASIAVHVALERQLAKEGTNRHKLGREEFLKRAWAWREKYGNVIL